MTERTLFKEIPGGKNNFHSAVLTCFCFDFQYFENQALKAMKQKWITSINVLADQNMLDDAFEMSIGQLKHLSQSYVVTGIESRGAFHPKINFFIGYDSLLVLWGSGNITPGGHGKNHELFGGLYADKHNQKHLPLILETWEYLLNHSKQLEGYCYDRINKDIPENCSLLKKGPISKHTFQAINNECEIALLYNEETSIFTQLVDLLPVRSVSRITIICPYFDENGDSIGNLLERFPSAVIEIFVQKEYGLPPLKFSPNERVYFYDFDKTDRGKKALTAYKRKLHSKILHFETEKEHYCLVGSANATIPGLGLPYKKALNEEFSALYKSSSYHFLEELGIVGEKERVTSFIKKDLLHDSSIVKGNPKKIRIKTIDLEVGRVKLYCKGILSDMRNLSLLLFDLYEVERFKLPIQYIENRPVIELLTNEIPNIPLYGVIVDSENHILSNKQLINNVYKLHNTHPSKENRNIQQIITSIDDGNINEFELVDFVNKLTTERPPDDFHRNSTGNGNKEKTVDKLYEPQYTYEEASKTANSTISKIIHNHSYTKLWTSIENLFNQKSSYLVDELIDEEEQGCADESRQRKYEEKEQKVRKVDYRKVQFNSITKMVDNYLNHLRKKKNDIGIIDYEEFLLVTYILTAICYFTDYSFPDNQTNLKNHIPVDIPTKERWRVILAEKYQSYMLDILKGFACIHIKREVISYDENNSHDNDRMKTLTQQVIYHVLIYGTLVLYKQRKHEDEVKNKIYIRLLNILNKCGLPDISFASYLENYSKVYGSESLVNQVIRTTKEIENILSERKENGYIYYKPHGFCHIKEISKKTYKLSSLLVDGLVSIHGSKV